MFLIKLIKKFHTIKIINILKNINFQLPNNDIYAQFPIKFKIIYLLEF